jgi:hypothetical protein
MLPKIIQIVFTAVLCFRANAQVAILPIREEEFQFSKGLITYSGTLTWPKGKVKLPVVILISGMGLQDRDWTFLKGK